MGAAASSGTGDDEPKKRTLFDPKSNKREEDEGPPNVHLPAHLHHIISAEHAKQAFLNFRLQDTNRDCNMQYDEFVIVSGLDASAFSQKIFHSFDVDGNGELDFREWLLLSSFKIEDIEARQKFLFGARLIDHNRDSVISWNELMGFARLFYEHYPGDVPERDFMQHLSDDLACSHAVDVDNLTIPEFLGLSRSSEALTAFLTSVHYRFCHVRMNRKIQRERQAKRFYQHLLAICENQEAFSSSFQELVDASSSYDHLMVEVQGGVVNADVSKGFEALDIQEISPPVRVTEDDLRPLPLPVGVIQRRAGALNRKLASSSTATGRKNLHVATTSQPGYRQYLLSPSSDVGGESPLPLQTTTTTYTTAGRHTSATTGSVDDEDVLVSEPPTTTKRTTAGRNTSGGGGGGGDGGELTRGRRTSGGGGGGGGGVGERAPSFGRRSDSSARGGVLRPLSRSEEGGRCEEGSAYPYQRPHSSSSVLPPPTNHLPSSSRPSSSLDHAPHTDLPSTSLNPRVPAPSVIHHRAPSGFHAPAMRPGRAPPVFSQNGPPGRPGMSAGLASGSAQWQPTLAHGHNHSLMGRAMALRGEIAAVAPAARSAPAASSKPVNLKYQTRAVPLSTDSATHMPRSGSSVGDGPAHGPGAGTDGGAGLLGHGPSPYTNMRCSSDVPSRGPHPTAFTTHRTPNTGPDLRPGPQGASYTSNALPYPVGNGPTYWPGPHVTTSHMAGRSDASNYRPSHMAGTSGGPHPGPGLHDTRLVRTSDGPHSRPGTHDPTTRLAGTSDGPHHRPGHDPTKRVAGTIDVPHPRPGPHVPTTHMGRTSDGPAYGSGSGNGFGRPRLAPLPSGATSQLV